MPWFAFFTLLWKKRWVTRQFLVALCCNTFFKRLHSDDFCLKQSNFPVTKKSTRHNNLIKEVMTPPEGLHATTQIDGINSTLLFSISFLVSFYCSVYFLFEHSFLFNRMTVWLLKFEINWYFEIPFVDGRRLLENGKDDCYFVIIWLSWCFCLLHFLMACCSEEQIIATSVKKTAEQISY